MKKVARGWRGLLIALLALTACSAEIAPSATQEDFNRSTQELQEGAGTVVAAASDDLALLALGQLPQHPPGISSLSLIANLATFSPRSLASADLPTLLGGIVPLSDQPLERGKWVYDPTIPGWVEDMSYGGNDLIFSWPFEDYDGNPHQASLTFDWENNNIPTVEVRDPDGTILEVPQDMQVTLEVDGQNAGNLRGQFSWYNCNGQLIFEPTSATLSGSAGISDRLEFDLSASISDTRISTSGSFSVTAAGDSASFSWDVWVAGSLQRDSDCFSSDFSVSTGHVNFQAASSVSGSSTSLEFNTDFTPNFDTNGDLASVDLADGFVKVDGTVAVTFSGTLDDANENCVPGENVTLVFADGTMTLEAYLIDQGASGCNY